MDNKKYPHSFLTMLFPKQFRTIPSTIIWTLVFFANVVIVFGVAHLLGFAILNAVNSTPTLMIYLVIAFGLFWLESFIYNRITQ